MTGTDILNIAASPQFPRHIWEYRTPPVFWVLSSPLWSLPIPWAGVKVCFPFPVTCPLLQITQWVGQGSQPHCQPDTCSPIPLGPLPKAWGLGNCPPRVRGQGMTAPRVLLATRIFSVGSSLILMQPYVGAHPVLHP